MRVFGLTTGADTAGINVAISRAFGRYALDWDVRSMVAARNYIEYPVDVPYGGLTGLELSLARLELERLYDAADVIHLHNSLHGHEWYDNRQGKPTVLMHHGMHSLEDYRGIVEEAREIGAVQVGSTLDLSVHEPDVIWLPAPVDLSAMRRIRTENYQPSETIRIGHAPTNRAIKGSDAFDSAIRTLKGEGLNVEPVLIEGLPWDECLRRKATVDIFFDQTTLGYGSNAIEAWAMGIPVVAGVANKDVWAAMVKRWGFLPFYETDEVSLVQSLRDLVNDRSLRSLIRDRGMLHVERWHDERRTVEALKAIYSSAKPTKPGGSSKRLTNAQIAKIYAAKQKSKVAEPVIAYDPLVYWQAAGKDTSHREHESRFVHTQVFADQEARLMETLERLDFASILEVGCGWGRITKLVHDRWPEVQYTAIDLSPERIESAKAKVKGVTFMAKSIDELDDRHRYDLVLATETLMHVKPQDIGRTVQKLCELASKHLVSLDWSAPLKGPIAPWNFLHDYASLYGDRLVSVEQIGLQAIYVVR